MVSRSRMVFSIAYKDYNYAATMHIRTLQPKSEALTLNLPKSSRFPGWVGLGLFARDELDLVAPEVYILQCMEKFPKP